MFAAPLVISFLGSGAIAVSANPAPLQKRANLTDVLGILTSLGSEVKPYVATLNGQAVNGTATVASVTPPIVGITSAFNNADSSLRALEAIDTTSGGSIADVINTLLSILSLVLTTLSSVGAVIFGVISDLLAVLGLATAFSQFLEGLATLFDGVINIISAVLAQFLGPFSTLGLFDSFLLPAGLGL